MIFLLFGLQKDYNSSLSLHRRERKKQTRNRLEEELQRNISRDIYAAQLLAHFILHILLHPMASRTFFIRDASGRRFGVIGPNKKNDNFMGPVDAADAVPFYCWDADLRKTKYNWTLTNNVITNDAYPDWQYPIEYV